MRATAIRGLQQLISAARRKCYILPVARVCNARCSFCATREYAPAVATEFLKPDARDLRILLASLVSNGVNTFEVTGGGVPTLHTEIRALLRVLRGLGPTRLRLYTNGSRLRAPV